MKLRVPPTEKNFPDIKNPPRVETPLREQVAYIWESLSETARIAVKALRDKITNKTTKP